MRLWRGPTWLNGASIAVWCWALYGMAASDKMTTHVNPGAVILVAIIPAVLTVDLLCWLFPRFDIRRAAPARPSEQPEIVRRYLPAPEASRDPPAR